MSDHTYNSELSAVLFVDGQTVDDIPSIQWEVSVELKCTYHGCAAQISGPPERCYPAEGAEFEWETITVFVGPHTILKTISAEAAELVLGKATFDRLITDAEEDADQNYEPEQPDGPEWDD